MVDLSQTIQAKSDQLNSDDLIGRTLTILITGVTATNTPEQPIAIHYQGDNGRPFKPCKSMRRVLVHIWGPDGKTYVGRSLTLYRDSGVKFGGMAVGGIRIKQMSHIREPITLALAETKKSKKSFTVTPLLTVPESGRLSEDVKHAGDTAASQGVDAYKAWLATLLPEVKEQVRGFHAEWSQRAKSHQTETHAEPVPPPTAEDGIHSDEPPAPENLPQGRRRGLKDALQDDRDGITEYLSV